MPETIKIAEIAIDNKKLLKSISDTKKEIDDLTKKQKELKQAGDTNSETFVQNEVALKNLKSEYSKQSKVLQTTTQASQKLTSEIKKEILSLDQASSNNKELRKIRGQVNTETVEGAQTLDEINSKIDANNDYIEQNASALEQQKIAIGNYKDGIKDAFQEMNVFNGGIEGFTQRAKDAGGVGNLLKGSLAGMAQGFVGLTKASLAFIATPVGAVITALVAVFLLVKNAMNRSEESTNKIKKAFSAFEGIMNAVLKILEPVGDFLIDGIVKGLELAEKAVYEAQDAFASFLDFLGFEEAAKNVRDFNEALKEGSANAKELADAQAELTKNQREAQKVMLDAQRSAELLRQQRDNENLSIRERIQANDELGKVLQLQLAKELEIANQALIVANLRIKAEGETRETLDAQAEALTTIADIQERITGQESEQLTNRVSLQKEANEKAKEIANKAIERQKAELDLFIAQQGIRAKTLKEQLKIEEEVANKSIEILDAELKNKNILQAEYDAELLNIKNELLKRNAEIAVENAEFELQQYLQNTERKIDTEKFFSDESLRIEQERLDAIAEKQREFAKLQFDEGIINQTEYNSAINAINEENRIANEEAELEREEARKEQELIDFENKRAIDDERRGDEIERAYERLEEDRLQEVTNAEKTGADVDLINQKYAQRKKQLDQAVGQAKLDAYAGVLGQIKGLFGEETAVSKAAAIAETTINTYKAATAAYSALAGIPIVGPVLGIAAAGLAVASGLSNVAKITSTNTKYADGGILVGASHARGGIRTPYGELEGGEAIINKRSTRMFAPILSQLNEAGGGRKFADGGILGSTNNSPTQLLDYDLLASKVAEANMSLPAPRVGVDEISTVSNRVQTIESSASF